LIVKVQTFTQELDPHSEREERVLFRMMEQYMGIGTGPVAVMEYEHDQAKGYIEAYMEAAEKCENLTEQEMAYNAGLIKNAYYILTEHFAKEENVLFPMAENLLSKEEKEELYKRIKEI
jgi:hemerythrin-like domain-containing protein